MVFGVTGLYGLGVLGVMGCTVLRLRLARKL